MTVYTLDLDKVHQTIRAALVEQVLPAVATESARGELHAVIEMLDNLSPRLSWDGAGVSESVSRTRDLAAAVGAESTAAGDGIDALAADRRAIAEKLAGAYAEGADPSVVSAVAQFSAADIRVEISRGLLPGLPS